MMGKNLKQREETPNINTTANKDIIQRLNFLYQASVYLQSLDVGLPRETPALKESAHKRKNPRTKRKTQKRTTGDLSREYIQCMRQVAQKTTVKIDPSLKRSLCFSCNSALVPGVSVSVRVEESSRHSSNIQYTCLNCKTKRRIPWTAEDPVGPPNTDNPNSVHDEQSYRAPKSTSRPLPLFARPDAGHVIFRGNDPFSLDEIGCVPFV